MEDLKSWGYLIGLCAAFGGAVAGFARLDFVTKKQCEKNRSQCSADCESDRSKERAAVSKKIDLICAELKENREHDREIMLQRAERDERIANFMGVVAQYMKDHCENITVRK